jgi:hypothetical protein
VRCIHFGFAVGPTNRVRVFVTLWALEFDGARLYVLGKQTERQLRPLQQRRILGGADQWASRDALGIHFRKGDTTCVAFIIFVGCVQLRNPPPPTAEYSATIKRVADLPVGRPGMASGGAGKRCTVRRYTEIIGAVEWVLSARR